MPKLKQADSQFLQSLVERPLTVQDLTRIITLWRENHGSWASMRRRGHMTNTIQRILDIAKGLIGRPADQALDAETLEQLFENVVKYRDESDSKSAQSEYSTTTQIVQALISSQSLRSFVLQPYVLDAADKRKIDLMAGRPLLINDLMSLVHIFELRKIKFQKPFFQNIDVPVVMFDDLKHYLMAQYLKGVAQHLDYQGLTKLQLEHLLALLEENKDHYPNIDVYQNLIKASSTYQRLILGVVPDEHRNERRHERRHEHRHEYRHERPIDIDHGDDNLPEVPVPAKNNLGFPARKPHKIPSPKPQAPIPHNNDLRVNQQAFLASLEGKDLTWGGIEDLARICDAQLSKEKNILGKMFNDLDKKGERDEVIDHVFRGRLFELSEEQHETIKHSELLSNVFEALFSTRTMKTCITVNVHSPDDEILALIEEMKKDCQDNFHGGQRRAMELMNGIKFIITSMDKMVRQIGGNYTFNLPEGGTLLAHCETYGHDKDKMRRCFRKFALSVVQAYQKAKHNDKVQTFFNEWTRGYGCIEGSTAEVLRWSALNLSDNKDIPLIVLPTFDKVFEEANLRLELGKEGSPALDWDAYKVADEVYNEIPRGEIYRGFPRDLLYKCQRNADFAPDQVITKEKLSEYVAEYIETHFYPDFDELVNRYVETALNQLLDHNADDAISANRVSARIYRLLQDAKQLKCRPKAPYTEDDDVIVIDEAMIKNYLTTALNYQEDPHAVLKPASELMQHYYEQAMERLLGQEKDLTPQNYFQDILLQYDLDRQPDCEIDDFYTPQGHLTAEVIYLFLVTQGVYDEPHDEYGQDADADEGQLYVMAPAVFA